MPDRTVRIVLAAVLVLLALYVAQPYLQPLLYSADTPRAVMARGDLAPEPQAPRGPASHLAAAAPGTRHAARIARPARR